LENVNGSKIISLRPERSETRFSNLDSRVLFRWRELVFTAPQGSSSKRAQTSKTDPSQSGKNTGNVCGRGGGMSLSST
jgi:hypothetical protein